MISTYCARGPSKLITPLLRSAHEVVSSGGVEWKNDFEAESDSFRMIRLQVWHTHIEFAFTFLTVPSSFCCSSGSSSSVYTGLAAGNDIFRRSNLRVGLGH